MPARLPRRLAAGTALAAVLATPALAGCSTGKDAVNQQNAGQNGYVAGDGKSESYRPADRKPAPAVTGKTLTGEKFDLSSLRGHVVVVNYWASWCAPCNAEAPDLEKVYQQDKASGVDFLGVDIRDQKDQANAFVRGRGVSYPSLFDPPGQVALAFRAVPPTTIPATMVLDRQGRVAAVVRRAVLANELTPLVATVLREPATGNG